MQRHPVYNKPGNLAHKRENQNSESRLPRSFVVVLVGTVYISTSIVDAWFTLYTSLPARDPVTKENYVDK
jgi:hypothetical protein